MLTYTSCLFIAMLTPYVWSRDLTGKYVQLVVNENTRDKMLVKTLPTLWYGKDLKTEGMMATAMRGACHSPRHRQTMPVELPPLKKGQQAVATSVFNTLDMLRGHAGSRLAADRRAAYINRLETAALDVVDTNISLGSLRAIRDVVQQARWVLLNDL